MIIMMIIIIIINNNDNNNNVNFCSAIILNGSNSAFGGFQLSKTNLIAGDKPNKSRLLRLRHDVALQHRSSTSPWVGGDSDTDQELRLDKPVAAYLKQL